MKTVMIAMLAAGVLAALGCGDKTPEPKPAASTPAAAAPADTAAAPAAPAKAPKGGW
jgi:hypothetical protein